MSSPVFQRKAREGSQEFKFEAEVCDGVGVESGGSA